MLDSVPCHARLGHARFAFTPGTEAEAQVILAQGAGAILHRLVSDQESEAALYAAKQVLDARLADAATRLSLPEGQGEALLDWLAETGAGLARRIEAAVRGEPRARRAVLRERAALALVAGAWCDTVSQPATQPGRAVNELLGQHYRWLGEGVIEKAVPELRRRAMNAAGVVLPGLIERSFAEKAMPAASTAMDAAYLVALSRYPANYLPEVVGTHLAYHGLALDTALFGVPAPFGAECLERLGRTYRNEIEGRPDAAELTGRMHRAVAVIVEIETRQAALLAELAEKTLAQNLDSQVAELVLRHAPMAGAHHRNVKLGGAAMSDIFAAPDVAIRSFMETFRKSFYLRTDKEGGCRFTRSLRFGGPMFGIFTAEEAAIFKAWADEIADNRDAPVVLMPARPDDPEGAALLERARTARPDGAVDAGSAAGRRPGAVLPPRQRRELPRHPSLARARAEEGLAIARGLVRARRGRALHGRQLLHLFARGVT
jgi:hypothetical protein